MTRECHVRFCERLRGKLPRSTYHFGMKAHISVDADSGVVHSVAGTAANVSDVTQAGGLLHGQEQVAFGDAGYRGVGKREEAKGPEWHVAMRPGERRKLNPFLPGQSELLTLEKWKASVRAKVEHPFRVLKQQFGYKKVRYRGLAKNTAQIVTLFTLGNLWMARRQLMGARG
jgi:IS5 family transposase